MSDPVETTLTDRIDVMNIPCELIDDRESFREDMDDQPAELSICALQQAIVSLTRGSAFVIEKIIVTHLTQADASLSSPAVVETHSLVPLDRVEPSSQSG